MENTFWDLWRDWEDLLSVKLEEDVALFLQGMAVATPWSRPRMPAAAQWLVTWTTVTVLLASHFWAVVQSTTIPHTLNRWSGVLRWGWVFTGIFLEPENSLTAAKGDSKCTLPSTFPSTLTKASYIMLVINWIIAGSSGRDKHKQWPYSNKGWSPPMHARNTYSMVHAYQWYSAGTSLSF